MAVVHLTDIFRSVLLFMSVINITLFVVILNRWSHSVPDDARRLLYIHVQLVSCATSILLIAIDAQSLAHLERKFVWYGTPLGLLGNFILLVSMWALIRWLGARSRQVNARQSTS